LTGIFAALMADHQKMEGLLSSHQVHLVERRMVAARSAWGEFATVLLAHLEAEDALVLPEYQARVTPERGGDAEIFRREHRRLQRFAREVSAWLQAWEDLPWPTSEVIYLVERQKTLKELLEHHDQREDQHLYAGLEKAMTTTEQQDLLKRFRHAEAQKSCSVDLSTDSSGASLVSGPATAALLATAWLTPLYDELIAGQVRPRADAPWTEARARLEDLSSALRAAPGVKEQNDLLGQLSSLLDVLTPMNCFPASRGTAVHASWQLLATARRAIEVAAEIEVTR
jgi:hypothetical protein